MIINTNKGNFYYQDETKFETITTALKNTKYIEIWYNEEYQGYRTISKIRINRENYVFKKTVTEIIL